MIAAAGAPDQGAGGSRNGVSPVEPPARSGLSTSSLHLSTYAPSPSGSAGTSTVGQ